MGSPRKGEVKHFSLSLFSGSSSRTMSLLHVLGYRTSDHPTPTQGSFQHRMILLPAPALLWATFLYTVYFLTSSIYLISLVNLIPFVSTNKTIRAENREIEGILQCNIRSASNSFKFWHNDFSVIDSLQEGKHNFWKMTLCFQQLSRGCYEIKAACHEKGQSSFDKDSMGRKNKILELKFWWMQQLAD